MADLVEDLQRPLPGVPGGTLVTGGVVRVPQVRQGLHLPVPVAEFAVYGQGPLVSLLLPEHRRG